MEKLNNHLLFRWFLGLNPDDAVWVPTVFTKNRDRLRDGRFTVDGTLLGAWASQKRLRPKDHPAPPPSDGDRSNPTVNFRKETRSNATHQSVTDPDARRARKSSSTAALLCHLGSVLMDNRHGLIVATDVRSPSGPAEREAGVEMLTTLAPRAPRRTLGADKATIRQTSWPMCARATRRRT